MTLNHYLRLHPELKWDEDIQKTIFPKTNVSFNQMEKNRILVFLQQMQHPLLRHEFLSLAHTHEEPVHQPDADQTRLRLERFAKIESFPK